MRRASNVRDYDRDVLRRGEALQRRRGSRGATEVRTTVVGSVLLFVGRHVAEVRLHRGDIRLVLCIRKLRNRNRGKNADDDDDDQKLDQRKTLFVAHFVSPLGTVTIHRSCIGLGGSRSGNHYLRKILAW